MKKKITPRAAAVVYGAIAIIVVFIWWSVRNTEPTALALDPKAAKEMENMLSEKILQDQSTGHVNCRMYDEMIVDAKLAQESADTLALMKKNRDQLCL